MAQASRCWKAVAAVLGVAIVAGAAWWVLSSPGATTLNVLGESTSTLEAIKARKDGFERSSGVSVNCLMATFEVLQQKANQDLGAGTGLYDVILNYNFSLSSYVGNSWVLTRSEMKNLAPDERLWRFEQDLFPNIWKETGFYPVRKGAEPEAVGFPFAGNTMLLVYDRKLFSDARQMADFKQRFGRELAPPATWEDFRQVAEFFTQPSNNLHGLVLQGASGGWLYYEWCNFAYSMKGGVLRKDHGWAGDVSTPVILDSPETIAATKFYLGLKPFSAGDYFATGQNEQVKLMKERKGAMAIMWSDVLHDLIRDDPNAFGFAPIPGSKSLIGGGIFYVNRKSKHPKQATEFVAYMLKKDEQIKLMQSGLCSPLRSVYDVPEVKAIPYSTALKSSLERGVYMVEAGPDADIILEIVTQAIQRIWRGQASVEEGLASAAQDLRSKRQAIFDAAGGG